MRKICWADGCERYGSHRRNATIPGLCPVHTGIALKWEWEIEETSVTCHWKGCGQTIDLEMFGWDSPLCPSHRGIVSEAIELEQWGVTADVGRYLECEDWIAAKWIAAILGRDRDNRQHLDNVIGDTPLFKIVTATMGDLYPDFPFLIPDDRP